MPTDRRYKPIFMERCVTGGIVVNRSNHFSGTRVLVNLTALLNRLGNEIGGLVTARPGECGAPILWLAARSPGVGSFGAPSPNCLNRARCERMDAMRTRLGTLAHAYRRVSG